MSFKSITFWEKVLYRFKMEAIQIQKFSFLQFYLLSLNNIILNTKHLRTLLIILPFKPIDNLDTFLQVFHHLKHLEFWTTEKARI